MPESYAHKKMGELVYRELPEDTRRLVKKHLKYFLAGLHGPDLLFFYRPGLDDHIREFGRKLHHTAFSGFYENAKKQIEIFGDDEKLVYFYGVLCHFMLDSICHPYVEKFRKEQGVTHGKLETEYERHLLLKDGHDPQIYPVAAHVGIDRALAGHIAPFYLGVNRKEILECLISYKLTQTVTRLDEPVSRKAITGIMNDCGYGEKVAGLIMSHDRSETCLPAMKELDRRMEIAVPAAVRAICDFTGCLYRPEAPEPEYVKADFYGQKA